MTAALCDAVTGGGDSTALLAQLERDNLFLVSLDAERRWYRYHHLFADLLRRRLRDAHAGREPDRPMDFHLTDEQLHLQATVRAFADRECVALAAEWDRDNRVPDHHFEEKLISMRPYGMTLPEQYGGGGRELLDAILVIEQLARVSPLCAAGVFESSVGPVRVIERFGTEAQRARWLPKVCRGETETSIGMSEPEAGSALTDLRTKVEKVDGGYKLNGAKAWCTGGGHSRAYLVYCRMSDQTLYILAATSDSQPLKVLYMGPPVTPTIVNQPASQDIFVGEQVTFRVSTFGGGPVTYQWRVNGTNILGATGAVLTVSPWFTHLSYDVIVSNPAGSATSQVATVTVRSMPKYANLTNNLVLHLKFDGDYLDSSGHTNDAIAFNSPTLVAGKIGSGAVYVNTQVPSNVFNAAYVSATSNPDLTFTETDSFSVACWVKYTGSSFP